MAYDLTIFTKLIGQAGSSAALQAKFPYLCDIHSLANALQNSSSSPLSGSRNPNGYDKYEMAYEIIQWFDNFADYPSGKAPSTIAQRYESSGINWNQGEFWKPGVYTVEQDAGYEAVAIRRYESGGFSPYEFVWQESEITTVPRLSPTSYPNPVDATAQLKMHSYGPVDYVTRDDGTGFLINGLSTTSKKIAGFRYVKTNLTQVTSTDGETANVKDVVPDGIPDHTSNYDMYDATGFTDTKPFGISSHAMELLNRPSDCNDVPIFYFLENEGITYTGTNTFEPGGHLPTFTMQVSNVNGYWEMPNPGLVKVDIENCLFRADGTQPDYLQNMLTHGFTGVREIGSTGSYTSQVNVDPHNIPYSCGQFGSEPTDVDVKIIGGELWIDFETLSRSITTGFYIRGLPVIGVDLLFGEFGGIHGVYYIPLHLLADFPIWIYGFSVGVLNTGLKVNNDVTIDCNGVALTAVRTAFSGYAEIVDGGVGYELNGGGSPQAGLFFPLEHYGRYISNPRGWGPRSDGRLDEYTLITADQDNRAVYGIYDDDLARLPRPITTILHTDYYYGDNDTTYQHSWFGTDNEYEDDQYWARELVLTNNKITGFGSYERPSESTVIPAVPGYPYNEPWVEETLNPNGLLYAYDGGPYGTKGEYENIPEVDFLTDIRWNSLDKGVFNVTITDGRITALTPINRTDGDGLENPGGWGYGNQRIALTLVRDTSVPLNSNTVLPKLYYNTETAAANGIGNRASVNLAEADQFTGLNLPNNAYLFAIAYGGGESSPLVSDPTYSHLDGNDANTASQRNVHPGFYPAEITITSERPVLRSTTRSLIDNVRSTGAQRYRFEYKYPPMTQESAKSLIASFEKMRGGAKAFRIQLPRVGVKVFQEYAQDTSYSSYIAPTEYYPEGENEIKLNGFPINERVVEEGTFFRFVDDPKLYQVVENADSNAYGEAVLRIEPGLKAAKGNGQPIIAKSPLDYLWVTVRFADDEMEYTTNGTGLFTLTFKFVEALA